MSDQLLRASSSIKALKANLPSDFELEERWVQEFNSAVGKIEASAGTDLTEFRVADADLHKSLASSNAVTGDVVYLDGRFCRREVLMHKIDALIGYLSELQTKQEKEMGFNRP
jgi:hypothetical protein